MTGRRRSVLVLVAGCGLVASVACGTEKRAVETSIYIDSMLKHKIGRISIISSELEKESGMLPSSLWSTTVPFNGKELPYLKWEWYGRAGTDWKDFLIDRDDELPVVTSRHCFWENAPIYKSRITIRGYWPDAMINHLVDEFEKGHQLEALGAKSHVLKALVHYSEKLADPPALGRKYLPKVCNGILATVERSPLNTPKQVELLDEMFDAQKQLLEIMSSIQDEASCSHWSRRSAETIVQVCLKKTRTRRCPQCKARHTQIRTDNISLKAWRTCLSFLNMVEDDIIEEDRRLYQAVCKQSYIAVACSPAVTADDVFDGFELYRIATLKMKSPAKTAEFLVEATTFLKNGPSQRENHSNNKDAKNTKEDYKHLVLTEKWIGRNFWDTEDLNEGLTTVRERIQQEKLDDAIAEAVKLKQLAESKSQPD